MITVKLCAFSDEADASLEGQIAALKRNNVPYMEMRNVNGKNVTELTLEEAKVIHISIVCLLFFNIFLLLKTTLLPPLFLLPL